MKVINKLESYPTGDMIVPYCPNCDNPTYSEKKCPFCNTELEYEEMIEKDKEIERLNKEIESWIKLINYNEIEDIPQYIEDLEVDNKSLKKENKEINKENKRLNNIIKEIEKCIDYYAIENDDFSKFYNNEEIEILKIIGSDKVE